MAQIKGLALVTFNLRQLRGSKLEAATKHALEGMGKVALDKVKENISYRDHSLAQLGAMGNPYARRHGSIKVHAANPFVVHSQSGGMLASLNGKIKKKGGSFVYRVGFGPKGRPLYVKFVIQGTKVMLGRDVLTHTVNDPKLRKEMMKAAVKAMGKDFRSQAGLRF